MHNLPPSLHAQALIQGPSSDSDDQHTGPCATSLRCANAEAKPSGPCNVFGVVGCVCAHTIPVRGAFVDMPTNEQFAYYLIILHELLLERPDLKDVYIDIGCRLMHTWVRYVESNPELPKEWADVRIMVNWMHASAHSLACEIANSARFKQDAGRRVGENTEQLWSMLKVHPTAV